MRPYSTGPNTSDQNFRNEIAGLRNYVANSAGLAIKAGSSALAKSVNTIYYWLNGVLYTKAAADMAALTGINIANGSKNVVAFCIDSAGTLTAVAGTAATTLAGIVPPTIPNNVAVIGWILIDNGTGSTFTGGTTALDAASLTVTYVNGVGPV